MKALRTIFILTAFIIAFGVLWYIANSSVEQKAVPALDEYIASSTDFRIASSTEQVSSVWMASSTIVDMLLPNDRSTTTITTEQKIDQSKVSKVKSVPVQAKDSVVKPTPTKIPAPISKSESLTKKSTLPLGYLEAPGGKIRVLIAKNPTTRQEGLSGYKSLDVDQGMLFIFPTPADVGFWMKDMNFPIDIVWMDKDRKILGINANVGPETYPKTFPSPNKVQFVLELNAGAAEKFGLVKGKYLSY